MAANRDLYSEWLGLAPGGARPPTPADLLGVPAGCVDPKIIDEAAHRQLAKLDRYAIHPDATLRAECHRLMNEVARARTRMQAAAGENAAKTSIPAATSPAPAAAPDFSSAPSSETPAPPGALRTARLVLAASLLILLVCAVTAVIMIRGRRRPAPEIAATRPAQTAPTAHVPVAATRNAATQVAVTAPVRPAATQTIAAVPPAIGEAVNVTMSVKTVRVGPHRVAFTWDKPAVDLDAIVIERSTDPTFAAGISTARLKPDATFYMDGRLSSGTRYFYRLVLHRGARSMTTVVMGQDMPAAPVGALRYWGELLTDKNRPSMEKASGVAVAVGREGCRVLSPDGHSVQYWSGSGAGSLPEGLTSDPASAVVEMSMGANHLMLLKAGGTVLVEVVASRPGDDNHKELAPPADLRGVVAVAAGEQHCLAVRSDGTVVAWGDNAYGRTDVPANLSHVVMVAAGAYHSLALRVDRTLVAWGKPGTREASVPDGLTGVQAIACGAYHNLALKQDGTVVAWGSTDAATKVPSGLRNVVAIVAGRNHNLAVTADGRVIAWGLNDEHQCDVPGNLSNVMAVAAGARGSAVLCLVQPATTEPTVAATQAASTKPAVPENFPVVTPPGPTGDVNAWINDLVARFPAAALPLPLGTREPEHVRRAEVAKTAARVTALEDAFKGKVIKCRVPSPTVTTVVTPAGRMLALESSFSGVTENSHPYSFSAGTLLPTDAKTDADHQAARRKLQQELAQGSVIIMSGKVARVTSDRGLGLQLGFLLEDCTITPGPAATILPTPATKPAPATQPAPAAEGPSMDVNAWTVQTLSGLYDRVFPIPVGAVRETKEIKETEDRKTRLREALLTRALLGKRVTCQLGRPEVQTVEGPKRELLVQLTAVGEAAGHKYGLVVRTYRPTDATTDAEHLAAKRKLERELAGGGLFAVTGTVSGISSPRDPAFVVGLIVDNAAIAPANGPVAAAPAAGPAAATAPDNAYPWLTKAVALIPDDLLPAEFTNRGNMTPREWSDAEDKKLHERNAILDLLLKGQDVTMKLNWVSVSGYTTRSSVLDIRGSANVKTEDGQTLKAWCFLIMPTGARNLAELKAAEQRASAALPAGNVSLLRGRITRAATYSSAPLTITLTFDGTGTITTTTEKAEPDPPERKKR